MCPHSDNRAVSALFRVFGGAGKPCVAETCRHGAARGMHVAELCFLALWVPLTALVAIGEWLCQRWGTAGGVLLALPLTFITLSLLPLALGGRGPASQWRLWLGVCTLWAVFRIHADGPVAIIAWSWLIIFTLNAAAVVLLGCGKCAIADSSAWRLSFFITLHAAALASGWRWGWPWAISCGALIALCYCLAVLRPSCQWLGPLRCRTGDGNILITIDDGPDPRDTPLLLDMLDEHQVKAVFFMIGEKVAAHPELAREVLRRGHELGNHTMTHPQASFWCAGPSRTRREIGDCQQVIEQVTGVKPRWFRAPVGHRNLFTHPVAGELGLEVMAWSRRGFDAVETDASRALTRILSKLSPGDIVLLHEATPIATEMLEGVLRTPGIRFSGSPGPD
ncbi:MAG: polysaccharide deacetylase family protein [Luteolibacter sp.]|jgi:peptidoglycan/xylan/chitin deacetylase (PgdA/CDA1 family)|nr:polysaccharide deacetylase family protein [Luteolibacter sp.]